MTRRQIVLTALLSCLLALPAFAGEPCQLGPGPAATLLLPYFEVDIDQADGMTTLMSINNASSEPTLTQITLWTDYGVPTVTFNMFLTGYDVTTINLRDIFVAGNLPITGDDQSDPSDTISPAGSPAWDGSFADCDSFFPFFVNPLIVGNIEDRVVNGHTGRPSPIEGDLCLGYDHGDGLARGYVTVDTTRRCSFDLPNEDGYFADDDSGVATNDNHLWGDYFLIDTANNFAHGESLVHIQAFEDHWQEGDVTFYGSLIGGATTDDREPLPTVFASRFLNGGGFDGGTRLSVWRDIDESTRQPVACNDRPDWYPLRSGYIVSFDEQESAFDACAPCGLCDPPPPPPACTPLATQRIQPGGAVTAGNSIDLIYDFGWLYLDFTWNYFDGRSPQSWVTTTHDANGRFSVGMSAVPLYGSCEETPLPPF